MPRFFRPSRPAKRLYGQHRFIPSAGPLRSTVGVAAGDATTVAVGVAVFASVGSTEGAAGVSGVGVSVKAFVGVATGAAEGSTPGVGVKLIVGVASGVAEVSGIADRRHYTSNQVLNLPVDCVLAGQQVSFKNGRAAGRALRHAFGE